jgi:phospholipid/cholesterol/gamma-HCH transport system permease protein
MIGDVEGSLVLRFRGPLTVDHIQELWGPSTEELRRSKTRQSIVDLSSVSKLDGAGLGLLAELRRISAAQSNELTFQGLKGELAELVHMSTSLEMGSDIHSPVARRPWIQALGTKVSDFLKELREGIVFTGRLLAALSAALGNPRSIRFPELLRAAEKAGVNALPIILLLGLLIGMIVALLAASVLHPFGATSLIPTIVSIGVVRELAPLMTAVFLAGRSGSFYAAEIGTMKITEELDALETFGLDKMRFLVVPRVLATMMTTPMLMTFFVFSSLLGGYAVSRVFEIGLPTYINAVRENIDYLDLIGSLAKSAVFGLVVASVGCLRGMQTGRGPGAVGVSTTRSLVTAVALIIAVDVLIGAVYYSLGI